MQIILRKEALEKGLKTYFTGKPCKHGHIAARDTKSSTCAECTRLTNERRYIEDPEKVKAQARKWVEANREKVREQKRIAQAKRRAADPGKYNQQAKEWRAKNPNAYREYYIKNREKIIARTAAHAAKDPEKRARQSKNWLEKNRERMSANYKRWEQNNKAKRREMTNARRARLRHAEPKWVDKKALVLIYADCPDGWEIDHIIPLQHPLVCGLHVPWNLEAKPRAENRAKCNKFCADTYVHELPL